MEFLKSFAEVNVAMAVGAVVGVAMFVDAVVGEALFFDGLVSVAVGDVMGVDAEDLLVSLLESLPSDIAVKWLLISS